MRRPTLALLAFAAIAAAGSASAQSRVWNFGDTTAPGACTGSYGTQGAAINCSQQPGGTVPTLAVTGWSAAGSGGTYAASAITQQGTGSGFGLTHGGESTASPEHAVDNSGQSDLLLLSFTSAQVLKQVTIGWSGADGDFQLLRWNGGGAPATLSGKTAANLVSAGWSLVSAVDGAGGTSTPDAVYNVNAGNLSSSYWLITAYNSAFGGTAFSAGIDAIKVLAVSASGVPEPGSLALATLALAGAATLRRRAGR